MIYNENLKRLFEILNLDPDKLFTDGVGLYDLRQAEAFMESIETTAYNEGYDTASSGVEGEIEDAMDEREEDVRGDIERYIRNSLYTDYLECLENEGIDDTSEEFTTEKQFEIIKDIILENI